MTGGFRLVTEFTLSLAQKEAVKRLRESIEAGETHQVLLGVTGSGKTFTVANLVNELNRPALVLAPNKTLAAQLYGEFKSLFPDNAVEYFVSYYDYYQPEAYIPQQDLYIEKDSSINDRIDRLRHAATHALLTRRDVIIVASVSCIYGLGDPESYEKMILYVEQGKVQGRDEILKRLIEIQYERNDVDFHRGTFRVRGDVVEIFPAYEDEHAVRIEFFGDEVEQISLIDPLRGKRLGHLKNILIPPASHYVTPRDVMKRAIDAILEELRERLALLNRENKLVEAQRLESRTMFDVEMMEEIGFCKGIENYSRHLTGRKAGEPPPTLIDYFPRDFLLVIDESHITVPQVGGMYRGDRSRKETLVEYGFRLPSALDNRPLKFDEFEERTGQTIYVSATPASYELKKTSGEVVEQIVRPTGLVDPVMIVRPAANQVDDLLAEVRETTARGERVLITTLTKRMAEDLTAYYKSLGVKTCYLHSDVDTLDRIRIIRELRLGVHEVLVGINLLREGLDIPEVSLVAILDADKEGFLRSETSLIQTSGRAARNVAGKVILYADRVTGSIERAMEESGRRRTIQLAYNQEHGITPESIRKRIDEVLNSIYEMDYVTVPTDEKTPFADPVELEREIKKLRKEMLDAAAALEFEQAARLRDRITELQTMEMEILDDGNAPRAEPAPPRSSRKKRRGK